MRVQLFARDGELYVLARSEDRAQKELAMRRRQLVALQRDIKALARRARAGRVGAMRKINRRLGRLQERWAGAWKYLKEVQGQGRQVRWRWDSRRLRSLRLLDGS